MKKISIFLWSLIIIFLIFITAFTILKADTNSGTNISSSDYSAWSDISGWWDFHGTHTVKVGTSSLSGYASSSIGDIALDCHTTRSGNICSTSNFQVTNPDGGGELAGCAWNDTNDWVAFSCKDGDCDGSLTPDASTTCAQAGNWGVIINSSGTFTGNAWNDIEGFINFNNSPTSSYKVATSWVPGRLVGYLESATIDTSITGGATLNSITWYGTLPSNTVVDFQVAVSNASSGPWNFFGPGGDNTAFYGSACPTASTGIPTSGTPVCVDRYLVANYRYLRYMARLQSNTSQSLSPTITDVVLNWSI